MEQVKTPPESIYPPELLLYKWFSHSARCFFDYKLKKDFPFCRSSTSQTTQQWIVSKQQQSPWWRQKKKCLVNKVRRSMGSKRFKRKKILTVKSFTQTFWVSTEETGHESLGRQWCKIRRKLPAALKTVIQKAYPGCADDANEVWWDFTPWKHHRMWWLHVIMLTKPILNITPITFYHSQFERCATEQVPHRSLYSSSAFHQRC